MELHNILDYSYYSLFRFPGRANILPQGLLLKIESP